MDISNIYNDSIISKRRKGTAEDPYFNIRESLQVVNGKAVLSEIPNRFNKVKVTDSNGFLFYESMDESKDNLFTVDYAQGVVFFDSVQNGKKLKFEYLGEGAHFFPSERVYYEKLSETDVLTVKDKITRVGLDLLEQKGRLDEQLTSLPQASEVVDLRIDNNGNVFPVAKDRIDAEQIKIESAYRDANGITHSSLKDRIDAEQSKIEEAYADKNNVKHQSLKIRIDKEQEKIEEAYVGSDGNTYVSLRERYDKIDDKIASLTRRVVNTFEDLKNTKAKKGEVISTLGYYSINDGGSGIYYIDDQVDSVYDITLTNGLKAHLISKSLNPLQFGAKGNANYLNATDGNWYQEEAMNTLSHDDTLSIQKAIDFASSKTIPLGGNTNKKYLISGQLNLKANVYNFDTMTFIFKGSISPNGYVIYCEDGVNVDSIKVQTNNKSVFQRVVRIGGKSKVQVINVECDNQHASADDTVDAAVVINGDSADIGTITVKNFDKAITLFNTTNVYISTVRFESYLRGLYIRKTKNCNIKFIYGEIKSPNALTEPGHNGLLIEECESINISYIKIYDAGEHAIRIGGVRDRVYNQKHFTFGEIITKRSGQCGFKAFTADGVRIQHVYIDSLTVVDCAYQNTPGTNEDGLYLIGVEYFFLGNFKCLRELNGVSAYRGMYISDTDKVTIENVEIREVGQIGIRIDDEYGRVNDIYLNNVTIRKCQNEGILIYHTNYELRDIIFKDIYIREFGATYYGVKIDTVSVYAPVLFDGYVSKGSSTGGFFSTTPNGLIYNKLVELT